MARLNSLLLAIVLMQASHVAAQSLRPDDKLIAAIDKLVEKNGIHANEPGVAVLIHQPGKLLFMKGYGLAQSQDQEADLATHDV